MDKKKLIRAMAKYARRVQDVCGGAACSRCEYNGTVACHVRYLGAASEDGIRQYIDSVWPDHNKQRRTKIEAAALRLCPTAKSIHWDEVGDAWARFSDGSSLIVFLAEPKDDEDRAVNAITEREAVK